MPSGNGDERNRNWIVTNLLDVAAHFLLDFLETGLAEGRFGRVHLVHTNNELLNTQSVGKKSVFTGLAVLGNAGLKLTSTTSNNQDSTISLNALNLIMNETK